MLGARKSDHTKRCGRADPDGLASTILTKCDPHWGAHFHCGEDRAFDVREAAGIRPFPGRRAFSGSMAQRRAQVGNAVPQLLARHIGGALRPFAAGG